MASLGDLFKNDVAKGVAIGVGVAAVGILAIPALRPAARAAVKTGLVLLEKGREWVAEASESFEDIVAEVRAELAEERLNVEAAAEVVEEPAADVPAPAE